MHPKKRSVTIAGVGIAAVLVLSACGTDETGTAGGMGGMSGGHSTSPSTSGMVVAGQAGDVMFAQMMLPHHQQAVEMADLALQKGTSSKEITQLAQQIKAAQNPEIETMNRWLREWNAPTASPSSPAAHGSGMMSDANMQELSAAKGQAFDQLWLTMMIEHHQGAVAMAQDVLKTTANPAVQQMAQAVVGGQNKEIATMKALL